MATISAGRRLLVILGAVLCAIARPCWADPVLQPVARLSPGEHRKLERGQILVRVAPDADPIKTVTSIGEVDSSAADVYRLTTDFKNYGRIYDSIKSVRIWSQGPDVVVASFHLGVPWPLPARTVTTRTVLEPRRFAFAWERTAGSMRVYAGQMVAQPLDSGHCIVYYSARVDPGYAWLPSWFVTWGQGYVLPSIIRAIRDTLGKHTGPYWAHGIQRPQFDRSWDRAPSASR